MNNLIKEIKKLKGFVLGIGEQSDSILNSMSKNNNIKVSLLTKNVESEIKNKSVNTSKSKKINLKKIKKYFKSEKPDYIICNIDDMFEYLKYFVKDSLYITTSKIYIYSKNSNIDLDLIIKRYKRYKVDVLINNNVIIVDSSNYKNNTLKNIFYMITDTIYNIFDFASNILAS